VVTGRNLRRLGAAAALAGLAGVVLGWLLGRRRGSERVAVTLGRRRLREPAPGDRRLSVVVPAYREPRIAGTVAAIRHALADLDATGDLEIIVVDDGSPDGTGDRASDAGADQVVRLGVNRGKGAAVRAGVLASHGRTVAFTDADLAYPPAQLATLCAEVESGWDVVVGSRRHTETTTLVRAGALRQLGGRVINALTRLVLLGGYRDTQCGLKAFRSDAAHLIFANSHVDGFAFDVEVLHLVERYGLSLTEVPVQVRHSTTSSVRVLRDAALLVRDLFRIRAWSARGVYDTVDAPAGTVAGVGGWSGTSGLG
jgi:glycosyltransferase involved in cell wall biosynthesis